MSTTVRDQRLGGGIQCEGGLCDEDGNCPAGEALGDKANACKEDCDWQGFREARTAYLRHLEAAREPRHVYGKTSTAYEPPAHHIGGLGKVREGSKGVSAVKGHSHPVKREET